MTKEELEKYTVDFMNNEASINWAKIDSIMGKTLIKYAEVFQKRIAELEKINTDGLSELNHINGDLIIENEKLRKENAELKERLKEYESIGNAQFWENIWSWKTKAEQLTKAKELLKRFIELENCTLDYDDIKEAEQFLKEE